MRFSRVFFGLCCLCIAHRICAQWEILDAHTTSNLRGIDYLGNGVAWASGTDGTVLRTEDMGFVWQLCTVPPGAEKLDFRGIQAFDNNTAIVMSSGKGELSRLYKTTDGCQTWKLLFTNPDKDGFWDAIKFDSAKTGMLIGDPVKNVFPLFTSIDAGSSWRRVDNVKPYAGNSGAKNAWSESMFAASNSTLLIQRNPIQHGGLLILFLTGGGHSSLHSIETFDEPIPLLGGEVMISTKSTRLREGESSGGFAMAAPAGRMPSTLVLVGGDYKMPDAEDGTAAYCEWKADALSSSYGCDVAVRFPHGYRSSVSYEPATHAYITVGPNGTDVSTDDGRNWHPLKPGPGDAPDADQHWNALSLPFVVGPKGRIGLLRQDRLEGSTAKSK